MARRPTSHTTPEMFSLSNLHLMFHLMSYLMSHAVPQLVSHPIPRLPHPLRTLIYEFLDVETVSIGKKEF